MCNTDIKHQELGRVLSNECIAPGVFVMEITAPLICNEARPGQFVHIRVVDSPIQLLRMPFGIYDCNPEIGSIETGKLADFVVCDEALNRRAVYMGGRALEAASK